MTFKEMNLRAPEVDSHRIKINDDLYLDVRTYLPIDEKADLITWVINMALDDRTGCISPIRFETFFSLAVVQRYAGVELEDDDKPQEVYDLLETNDVIDAVIGAIPLDEFSFLSDLAKDTAADIARYNNSLAGMINIMNTDAQNLDVELENILKKIKNSEGLEQLSVIKDMVGTD